MKLRDLISTFWKIADKTTIISMRGTARILAWTGRHSPLAQTTALQAALILAAGSGLFESFGIVGSAALVILLRKEAKRKWQRKQDKISRRKSTSNARSATNQLNLQKTKTDTCRDDVSRADSMPERRTNAVDSKKESNAWPKKNVPAQRPNVPLADAFSDLASHGGCMSKTPSSAIEIPKGDSL